ncbi:hypothetical protein PIB30_113688, partial [Stylosanthes scabra]|nr:hypothetical protein [Stylosanthes scabra]
SVTMTVPPSQMPWVGGPSAARFHAYDEFPSQEFQRRGPRSRKRPWFFTSGAKTSALNRVVFPEGKGKEAIVDPKTDSEMFKEDEGDDLYDDEFVEEDEMVSVVSILPAEFADGSRECLDGDYYDPAQGEDFLWVRNEREAIFTRPTEEEKAHLKPLHIK